MQPPSRHTQLTCAVGGSLSEAVSLLFSLKLFAGAAAATRRRKRRVIFKRKRSEDAGSCAGLFVLLPLLSLKLCSAGRRAGASEEKTSKSTTKHPLVQHGKASVASVIIALQIANIQARVCAGACVCLCVNVCVRLALLSP